LSSYFLFYARLRQLHSSCSSPLLVYKENTFMIWAETWHRPNSEASHVYVSACYASLRKVIKDISGVSSLIRKERLRLWPRPRTRDRLFSVTKGMGLPSPQQFFLQWFYFASLLLHVSVIRPSSCGIT
jgi:hypothetical protein